MKKHIKPFATAILGTVLALTPLACSDFLEKPPQGTLLSQNFPTTEADALQAVNAVYNTMRISEFNFGLFPIMDIMSDDAHKGSNPTDQRSFIGPYDNFTHQATESSVKAWYSTLYQGVKRANVVIESVPLIAMDEGLRNRIVGEAKFLRALFYFDLTRAWGDVPMVTTVNAPLNLERQSTADILDLIETDLEDAIAGLWEKNDDRFTPDDLGRVTTGAAHGLLARVHLWQGEFPEAEIHAMAVITSAQYDLEVAFGDANGVNGEHGVESVFEVGAFPNESITTGGNQYANVQGVRGFPNRGWGFNRPSQNLIAAFEPGDPRLDSTVLDLGEFQDGIKIQGDGDTPDLGNNGLVYPAFPTGIVEKECYNQKVWTPGENVPTQFGHNRRIIRYADVLLMAAEALNENNKATEARLYLNEVRSRVGRADINDTDKGVLRDKIFNERRVELALEGHRFWDLVRTGRAEAVLGPFGFKPEKHKLLALPQTELDLTGWEQNPNW